VFLGNRVIEEKGHEQRGADRGKARIVNRPAVLRVKLRVFRVAAIPSGGDVSKGSFHSCRSTRKKRPTFHLDKSL